MTNPFMGISMFDAGGNNMKKRWVYPHITIATGNKNKLKQFAELFAKHLGLEVKGLADYPDMPEIVEDCDTFEGNAIKKAETISRMLNIPVVSDDSGLVVPALGGEPGVYSARYSGPGATDEQNNLKLLGKIQAIPPERREGFYVCAMALAVPGEKTEVVRGECRGIITDQPRGEWGFGYDPLFYFPEKGKTMAELTNEEKFAFSHRARATEKLIALLKERYLFS
jgi:XTP/dITP diphosphohydrolase